MQINGRNWQQRWNASGFLLPQSATIRDAVERFAEVRAKALFVQDAEGRVIGVYSRGDLLRQLAGNGDGATPVVCNRTFLRLYEGQSPQHAFGKHALGKVNTLPLLDRGDRLKKIFEKQEQPTLTVGETSYAPHRRVMMVAEIGNNHNGSFECAQKMVDAAVAAGADAVKFQARALESTYIDTSDAFLQKTDFATAYTVRELKRFNLTFDQLSALMDYARAQGIYALCTPFDEESLRWLLTYGPDALKIASADFLNVGFRDLLAQASMPILMSTGMSTLADIEAVSAWAMSNYVDATFLHTNSTYPTPYEDVHLSFLEELVHLSPSGLVGYSGHERGIHIPLVALAHGCVVIEKHLTFDKAQEGNDHKVSLLPDEFATLVRQGREILTALAPDRPMSREVSQGERLNAISLSKGCYLVRPIEEGAVVTAEDVVFASPCVGLNPMEFSRLHQPVLKRSRPAGAPLVSGDFELWAPDGEAGADLLGRFGLPVRMRDVRMVWDRFRPCFAEYHLFSTDLEIDPSAFKEDLDGVTLTFHAPEQFDDGFIIDVVSDRQEVRERTAREIGRCVDWCLRAVEASGVDQAVSIIVNVGGATRDLSASGEFDRKLALARVGKLVETYADKGVTLLPQTMPPHPWHFGGQAFHRLFVDFDDMIAAQEFASVRFCFDLSHSYLAVSHLGRQLEDELPRVLDLIGYYHISDARYPNGEGLQVNEGDVQFEHFLGQSNLLGSGTPWIPEIWNGHMNDFEGFRVALSRMKEFAKGD